MADMNTNPYRISLLLREELALGWDAFVCGGPRPAWKSDAPLPSVWAVRALGYDLASFVDHVCPATLGELRSRESMSDYMLADLLVELFQHRGASPLEALGMVQTMLVDNDLRAAA